MTIGLVDDMDKTKSLELFFYFFYSLGMMT